MGWQSTAYTILLILSGLGTATLASYIWHRHRNRPEARTLVFLMAGVAIWSLVYMLELEATQLSVKFFWHKIKFLGIVIVPPAWLVLAIQYSGRERWLKRRNLMFLAIGSIISLLLVWTNDYHHLFWTSVTLDNSNVFSVLSNSLGIMLWFFVGYCYVLLFLGTLLVVEAFIRSHNLYRRQTSAMLLAAVTPWFANAIYLAGLSPYPHLDVTPLALTITCLACVWALFRYRFLDIMPVARGTIIEGMDDAIIVLDEVSNIIDTNPPAQHLMGLEASEMIGQPLEQVWPHLSHEIMEDSAETSKEIVLGGDDEQRIFDLRISSLLDWRKRPVCRVVILRDITERKRAEKALQESESRYRRLFESSSDAIMLLDEKGFIDCNSTTLRIFGCATREEFCGKHPSEFSPPRQPDMKDSRQAVDKRIVEAVQEGQSFFEWVHRRTDGDNFPAEVLLTPMEWAGKKILQATVRDITQRKKAEEALKESEERFRSLVNNLLTGIYVRDEDNVLFVNKRLGEMLGYTREELLGMSLFDIVHPDDREIALEQAVRRISGEHPEKYKQYRVVTKNGSILWVEVFGVLIDYRGKTAILGNVNDITERKKAEEGLKESEERYRTLVEEATDIIVTIDMKTGVISSANNFGAKVLGYEREHVVGKLSFLEMIHPDDHERVLIRLQGLAYENQREPNFPLRLLKSDGTCIHAEINGAVTYDNKGAPETFMGVIRNVTEQKRAEQALRESERRYRLLADNVKDIIWTLDIGTLRFTYMSPSVTAVLGYSLDDVVSLRLENILTPDSLRTAMEALSGQLAPENIEHQGPVWSRTIELEQRCKDGTTTWGEMTVTFVRDATGKPVELLGVTRGITERRQAEEMLRKSEEKYRTLFEESKDVVFIITPEGEILDMNSAGLELFGYSSEGDLRDINVIEDAHVDSQNLKILRSKMASQGFVKDYELNLRKKDGSQVIGFVTASAVHDENGDLIAYRGILRDVTEEKQLEQQLIQAQKMESIGTLAGGIAHDFNNLLGGVLGYASLIKTRISEDHELYRYVNTIEISAMRAAELTGQLLAFARGGKYNIKPVVLNGVVEETLRIIDSTFDKSIEIKTHLHPQLPAVEADSGQMQQVLMNLCVNSRDAMPAGGELIIDTDFVRLSDEYARAHMGAKPGLYAVLSVTDTGMGMEKETAQKVFEPFFTTKEDGKGTGLGLSMVYGVVKNHDGYIAVYSEPGQGATFKIYLPAKGIPEKEEMSVSGVHLGGSELVLVVDDEDVMRSIAKDILEAHGYSVLLAQDGIEAVNVYREHKDEIHLVILDMVMPKRGGRETFSELKALNPDIKAILSTGYSRSGKAQDILDSGVMGFVQKPYQVGLLLSKVRCVLDDSMVN